MMRLPYDRDILDIQELCREQFPERYGDSGAEIACIFGPESLHKVLEAFVTLIL